jgi:hypothetical protein
MIVTLDLTPDIEADLLARAAAGGQTPGEYLRLLVEASTRPAGLPNSTPEQRAAAFEAWSASHRRTPLLSDYAVSRESIYSDCDAE